ncbi:MAG: ATP-binding cassette domain-containing protein [Candidatus Bipolaricaulota bacterium]
MSWSSDFDLEVRDLVVRYGDRQEPALDGISEVIERGEVVAISGPSGCGKTTLCRVLCGVIPGLVPAQVTGEARLGDRRIGHEGAEMLASSIGFVQQDADAQICTLSVWQEVAFGPENLRLAEEEIRTRVADALSDLGIESLRDRKTTTLSGGEKQRLAVASVLAMRPGILLLDEPTANLDPRGVQQLFALLARTTHREAQTLILVEHRVEALRSLAPRLVLLERGRIVRRLSAYAPWDLSPLGLRGDWPPAASETKASLTLASARHVTFRYRDGGPLIEDLSLDLRGGEVLAVIGPNGGGKTSLLRLLAGLAQPLEGRVERPRTVRVGFVFQHPHHQIFERTVRREICFAPALSPENGESRLREARLDHVAGAAPLSLSLGEQRRLTVATAMAQHPNILLLDEPFIGQDRQNVLWVISCLRRVVAEGGAVVLVTHDIPLVDALADRVLFLDRRTALLGRRDEVFASLRERGDTPFTPEAWR